MSAPLTAPATTAAPAPINVRIGGPDIALGAEWDALVQQGGNAFMDPVALKAAAESSGARIVTLSAWSGERLVGFWALGIRRPLPFLPAQLEALPFSYAFLSTPILDPQHGPAVMSAFLATIGSAANLPRALWLKDFDSEGAAFASLATLPHRMIRRLGRPIVTRAFGVKSTGSTRKKLRQDWNRLTATGPTAVINTRDCQSANAGLDAFFALEAASWKGARGTALANDRDDARFARALVTGMAAKGDASVALLQVDGKVIAAQVLLYCGTTAYTWKTAYDTEWSRFSPGALLVDKVTETLLATDIALIDSCSLDTGFMGRLWEGRKDTVDLVVSPRPRPGPAFWFAAVYWQTYDWLRQRRNQWRDRQKPS